MKTVQTMVCSAACFAMAMLAVTGATPAAAEPSSAIIQSPGPAAAQQRPENIIFVLIDDLRFDGMGFLTPQLKTPNIDYLAAHGTYFSNAVVSSSLCSPSRATILTGETPRNHRVVDNTNSSEDGLIFFPSYLQKAGYQTAFVGKWHMGVNDDNPRAGFDRWVSFKGQGNYWPTTDESPALIKQGKVHMLNVDGKEVPQKGYITTELTDYALDWLAHGRDSSKPFFLYLSHKAVHSMPLPEPKYQGQYDHITFKLPANMADTDANYKGKPMWVRNQRNSWHGVDFMYNSDTDIQNYMRRYYETLSSVDDSVGRILDYLRRTHQDKNTMIVFTSDNGFQFGEHGLIDKRNAYEASIRVPLVIWAPGMVKQGVTDATRVRNLDFAPTFLDVAHAPEPEQFEGKSFLPVAEGKMTTAQWQPQDFTYEYYWDWQFPMTPTTFAVEHDHVKYITYHGVWDTDELYDLAKDPDEMHNLIDDPAYAAQRIDLRKRLYDELANRKSEHSIPFTYKYAPGQIRRSMQGKEAAPFPDNWLIAPNPKDKAKFWKPEILPDQKPVEDGENP